MKSEPTTRRWAAALILVIIVLTAGCSRPTSPASRTAIRIGWQVPLATQGQIVQVLKRTDLLQRYGFDATFIPFSYGGPQSEAALAGELDVIFVGDQPAINLIARGGQWKIVSRLFYTKTSIMVPPTSTINSIGQLRGRTVATPFGSVAHREATLKEEASGLNPDKDVKNINLDILEISNVVQAGGQQSWGKIDAVGVWEPSASLFELKKLARTVDSTRTLGVIAISEDFIAKHGNAPVRFLSATLTAWAYFATHADQVDQWYIKDARLSYSADVLRLAASVEPNYSAKTVSDVDLRLSEENLATLQRGAVWAFDRGFTKAKPDMRLAVDTSFLMKAIQEAGKAPSGLANVRVNP